MAQRKYPRPLLIFKRKIVVTFFTKLRQIIIDKIKLGLKVLTFASLPAACASLRSRLWRGIIFLIASTQTTTDVKCFSKSPS